MNKKSLHFFAILQIVFILSSCSSLQGLKFWETDEVDPDEPKELSSYENQKDISIIWNLSFDGENEIGNFEPGFSSQNLFFADCQKLKKTRNFLVFLAFKILVQHLSDGFYFPPNCYCF